MDLPLPELSSEGRKRRENAVPLVSDIVGGWGVLVSPLPAPSSAWFSCCSRSDEAKQNLLMLNHECIFIRLVWYKNCVFTWGTKTGRARTGSERGDSFGVHSENKLWCNSPTNYEDGLNHLHGKRWCKILLRTKPNTEKYSPTLHLLHPQEHNSEKCSPNSLLLRAPIWAE